MGRSTRFFGGRVLHSGRRVWTGPAPENFLDGKKTHCNLDEELVELVELKFKVNEAVGCNKEGNAIGCVVSKVDKDVDGFDSKLRMDVDEGENKQERNELFEEGEREVEEIVDKMYGIVYRRKGKRKRGEEKEKECRQYFRRKKRSRVYNHEYDYKNSGFDAPNVLNGHRKSVLKLSVGVGAYGIRCGSGSSYSVISSLLHSILRYLRKADIRLRSMSAFVCTEPIVHVFAEHGIRFSQNFSSEGEVGSCIITGVRSSVPVLSVDFAALPFVFLHLHSSLSLWSSRLFYFSWTESEELNSISEFSSLMPLKRNQTECEFMVDTNARAVYFSGTDLNRSESEEELNSINEFPSFTPFKRNQTGCEFVVDIGAIVVALPAFGVNKVGDQSVHIKSGCKIQKKRNSLRKPNRASCHSIFRSRHDGIQFPSQVATHQLRRSNQRKVLSDVNKLKSTSVEITQKTGAGSCSANILDIESDKCFRSIRDGIQFSSQVSTHQLRSSNRRKVLSDVNKLKSTSVEITQKTGAGSCSDNILDIESDKCFRSIHDGIQFSSQVSTHQLRSSNQRKVISDVNKLKSTSVEITQKTGAGSCSANILVIESDKCYRIEGALTTLELSESNHWCLIMRKDGVKRYSITAQNVMRPCSINRITHDIVWSRDTDLKLEFPNRHYWLIFKELYKECYERNLKMPVPSFIPVPRVSEVDGYGKIGYLPFERPDCYISVKDDELTRVLKKRTANYDMDSDDEDWLHKFNSVYNEECEVDEDLSAERFELMIDAFEKAYHCNPDVFTNAEAAYSIFPDLDTKVVEAVYNNWIMKRKLKRAALVRVFQFYQQRKSQFISTFSSRKKRSFKRQGSQAGRGKQRSFFHAFVAGQDAIEQQNILKVQEAKATLDRLENLASQKRQRAQELFENSEIATYKALMAVRISEAAQVTGSTHVAASYIIG